MIDIHNHLLPGIDDGAPDMETALAMARLAVSNGIKRSVLTPHHHPGRYGNDRVSINQSLKAFQAALAEADIALDIRAAAEVRLTSEIPSLVENQGLPLLGELNKKQIVLLEFPHGSIPPGSDKLVEWLLDQNICPLIAHPERNEDVICNLEKIVPFVAVGCLLQVTAGSVAGDFGEIAKQRTEELLREGWVYVLASDAHNLGPRIPDLEPGRLAAEKIIGEEESWCLVRDNPWSIVKGLFENELVL